MSIVHGRQPEGEEVKGTNPVLIGVRDDDGNAAFLTVDSDGKISVKTDIDLNISSVTATDVTIRDSTTADNKLAVADDGSIGVTIVGDLFTELEPAQVEEILSADILQQLVDIEGKITDVEDKLGDIETQLDGVINVRMVGNKVVESLSQEDAVEEVLTFTEDIIAVEIWHNEVDAQEFSVNGIALMVPPGGWRSAIGGTPDKDVLIPEGVDCIVYRLE